MKHFRLLVHQKTFSDEDLIINPKDFLEAKEGDIVEIYHPDAENDNPRLLLQIKMFKDDLLTKDTVSVEQSIATAFGLQTYKHQTVCVKIVNPNDVALDSVELTFKDQYMGRSEMWRLKQSLTNTCVYMNKKVEFCGGAIRCQVYEMWSLGDRVACGVINDETKIVFRSSTSLVYLFLQMSSEMWDFDIYGDLYFEKAVNGFLADLFQKWKKNGSNHEVTIVLFSRTFYQANTLEEFPEHMRECLQQDYRGRYYEDFYRVACQNEKFDDWSTMLVQLRKLFAGYLKVVLEYHSKPGITIPASTNSTAAQGNFLEVLNMSLNVFEKHYLDRSFDRTGQLSVVVTPGVGVFEVDRELTNVTKQRIIDNGVGSDLVCVGEQPLHAVPLLKFHNKDTNMNVPDDYSMPHWINLSFYSSNKKIAYSNFIPRIKFPPMPSKHTRIKELPKQKLVPEEEYLHNSFFDYDAYDAQVFQLPSVHGSNNRQRSSARYKKTSGSLLDPQEQTRIRRKLSDPDIYHPCESPKKSQAVPIPSTPISPMISPFSGTNEDKNWAISSDKDFSPPPRLVVGSAGSPPVVGFSNEQHRSRALINPFDPSHVTIKLTSNRRRWTHIFPKGPTGVLIQQHHYQAVPAQPLYSKESRPNSPVSEAQFSTVPSNSFANSSNNSISAAALLEYCKKRPNHHNSSHSVASQTKSSKGTLLWGATGEQEWTPALTTVNEVLIGVDWKSLTIPACLPITTDYFPDKRALQVDYVFSLYHLLPDDVNADFAQQRTNYKKPLSTAEVFRELVSQRLAQGFQLILLPNKDYSLYPTQTSSSASLLSRKRAETEPIEVFYLSIGRIFHKISLSGNAITVTRYRPRHPYPSFNIHYRYRFQAPYHETYEVSWVSFTTEKLENYHWNYLDHYICTRGDTDFLLVEALKYWRFRIYLLPLNNSATKRIIEGAPHYDIYSPLTASDHTLNAEGFLKFIETAVNKIKRACTVKKPRMSLSMPNNASLIQQRRLSLSAIILKNEALNQTTSLRCGDRGVATAIRSGSKGMERGRNSPAVETSQGQTYDSTTHETNDENVFIQEIHLRVTATSAEIVEALRHPITGLNILNAQQNLPSTTFVAADAVNWLISNMEGVTCIEHAVRIMESLRREQLICHASGEYTKQFVYGFFLFYFTQIDKDENILPSGDLQGFENEWLEVEMRPSLNWGNSMSSTTINVPNRTVVQDRESGVPHFLCEAIDATYLQGDLDNDCPMYKSMYLDVDFSNKSDRVEWGHARYQTIFRPDQAYEIVVEWLVASGSIVAELLFSWHRKAQACGLQLIPIPHDPLALPYSNKSDPLRGPIFIPLDTKCLIQKHKRLFEEFREDTWIDRMFLFQEAILSRFGFLPCMVQPRQSGQSTPMCQEHQYIHCTGTVFILLPSPIPRLRNRLTSISQRRTGSRYPSHIDMAPSPHEAYITRHVSGKNKDDYDTTKKIGFLWSWNHMVSRRWRTNQAVDYNFQVKMLKDFREFCSNHDNRLKYYWEQCWEVKEDACTKPI